MAVEERGLGRRLGLERAHRTLGILVHADRHRTSRQGLRLCISASSRVKVMLLVRGPHFKQQWGREASLPARLAVMLWGLMGDPL